MTEAVKKEKPKGIIGKIKENIDDKEELVRMNSVKMQDDINVTYTQNLKEKMLIIFFLIHYLYLQNQRVFC